jgi:DNA-directed RNA polymerase specialized sigma24 family protein
MTIPSDPPPAVPLPAVPPPPMLAIDPADHIGLAVTIAADFVRLGHDVLDSEPFGDALLALVRAAAGIDPARLDEFPRYAATAMRNQIAASHRWQSRPGRTAVRFSEIDGRDDGRDDRSRRGGFAAALVDRHREADPEAQELAARLLGCLTDREWRLVERVVMGGWTLREAGQAEERPVTGEAVRLAVGKALRKMRRAAEREAGGRG